MKIHVLKLQELYIPDYRELLYNNCSVNIMFVIIGKLLNLNSKSNSEFSKKRGGQVKKTLIELTQHQKDAIVGTSLGDCYIERVKSTHNTRLRFDQTFPYHAPYLTRLYMLFKNLVGAAPKINIRKADKRTGKSYVTISFKTLRYSCFNYFYDLFYVNGVKVVPFNIKELLTARALAYWIMDDGGKSTNGDIILHTRAFTLNDVNKLRDALSSNFGFTTRIYEKTPGQWVIVIPKVHSEDLKSLVAHNMCPSMLYKL